MGSQDDFRVEVIRSSRRKKTISGRLVGDDVVEIRAPAGLSDEELQPYIEKLLNRFRKQKERKKLSDEDLERRAGRLNKKYFGGKLRWSSITWSTNQSSVFGSCTPSTGAIRISHQLADAPSWVLDYVLMHELAHLLERNHGKRFWDLVHRYPLAERAMGYLMAMGYREES